MHAGFRARLLAGDRLIGTLISLPSPEVAELLAEVGFDWLFIDAEHGPFESAGALRLLQAVGARCASLVRVPAGEELWIKKALDIGAAGVIIPRQHRGAGAPGGAALQVSALGDARRRHRTRTAMASGFRTTLQKRTTASR